MEDGFHGEGIRRCWEWVGQSKPVGVLLTIQLAVGVMGSLCNSWQFIQGLEDSIK